MKKTIILALLLAMVFSCSAIVHASTASDFEKPIRANLEQIKILNGLNGSDVTIGEVLRKVFPSSVSSMPADILKQMDETKMEWPNANTLDKNTKETETTSSRLNRSITLTHQSVASSNGTRVEYYSRSVSSQSMPYMFVVSYLYEYQTNNYVDAVFNSGTNTKRVYATGSYDPSPGLYQAIGLHNGTYPDGNSPASYSGINSYSDAVGVLP